MSVAARVEAAASPAEASVSGLRANLLAGLAGSFVSLAAGLIATPLYLMLMGREGFGVLGFFLTVQGVLLALDGGAAVSITRRVASETRVSPESASLVRALSVLSWSTALLLPLVLGAAAPWAARHWLQLGALDAVYVGQTLAVAACVLGMRWPLYLYQGVLNGRHRIAAASLVTIAATILSTGGSVVALFLGHGDMRWMFGCQLVVSAAHVLATRSLARAAMGPAKSASVAQLGRFLRESLPVGGIAIVGLLTLHVDKLILSSMVPLDRFSDYVLAATASAALYAFVGPVFNVMYPRFSALWSRGASAELRAMYRGSSLALASFLLPLGAALACFARPVLTAWTGNAAVAANAAPLVTCLSLATALHGVMHAPYALRLACGEGRLAFAISAGLLAAAVPLVWLGAWLDGAAGAAAGVLAVHLLYATFAPAITHRRLMPGLGWRWFVVDVLPPAFISLALAGAGAAVARQAGWTAWVTVAWSTCIVLATWGILWALLPRLRATVRWSLPHSATLAPGASR